MESFYVSSDADQNELSNPFFMTSYLNSPSDSVPVEILTYLHPSRACPETNIPNKIAKKSL